MKRPTKIRVAALGAVMALTLSACGGTDDNAAGDSAQNGDDTSTGEGNGDGAGGGDYVIGVSNTLAGNGWREQMVCSI